MRLNITWCSLLLLCLCTHIFTSAQLTWHNVDAQYQPLPTSVQVFRTTDSLDGKPNNAYYVIADLKDKNVKFTTDTTLKRRFTPSQFYHRNDQPLIVVNCTFFSFETNQNLNVVIKEGRVVSHNAKTIKNPQDSTKRLRVYSSAIGIKKNRKPDVAWIKTDSSSKYAFASQEPVIPLKGRYWQARRNGNVVSSVEIDNFSKWKMKTAVGGGPVLIQNGEVKITNEEERMFTGKAVNDKHPRTAMGYTANRKLIILVVQGRSPGIAEGATLPQLAQMLKELGCIEALNLDGGGSSCLLVNGKETIKPSDKEGQRSVPAVFLIK